MTALNVNLKFFLFLHTPKLEYKCVHTLALARSE